MHRECVLPFVQEYILCEVQYNATLSLQLILHNLKLCLELIEEPTGKEKTMKLRTQSNKVAA